MARRCDASGEEEADAERMRQPAGHPGEKSCAPRWKGPIGDKQRYNLERREAKSEIPDIAVRSSRTEIPGDTTLIGTDAC